MHSCSIQEGTSKAEQACGTRDQGRGQKARDCLQQKGLAANLVRLRGQYRGRDRLDFCNRGDQHTSLILIAKGLLELCQGDGQQLKIISARHETMRKIRRPS